MDNAIELNESELGQLNNGSVKVKKATTTYDMNGEVIGWQILVYSSLGELNPLATQFKFWAVKFDEENQTARVRWGRIGTTGQEQSFDYYMGRKRQREKENKGYRTPTDEELAHYFNEKSMSLWEL